MKQPILLIFLFGVLNLLWLWGHILLFRTPIPALCFLSMFIHIVTLIIFPYNKTIKPNETTK